MTKKEEDMDERGDFGKSTELAREFEDYDAAQEYYEEALVISKEIGNQVESTNILIIWATWLLPCKTTPQRKPITRRRYNWP